MPEKVTIYHKSGKEQEMYEVDAREAVSHHPEEWSETPWKGAKELPDAGEGAKTKAGGVPTQTPPAGPVKVPHDWESLDFFGKQNLAQRIIGRQDPKMTKAQAEKIIRDYLAAQ